MTSKDVRWVIESLTPVEPAENETQVEESGSLGASAGAREWDAILIKEGPGSSGDYYREVLERDVPSAFPVGTKIYVDHPTESEAYDRPERSVRDLAGSIVAEASWDEAEGGMRSRLKIMKQWVPLIEEMGGEIGLSIRARAIVSPEVNESGRYDIMGIVPWPTNSVDIVTVPGAGGRFMEAVESIRATITNIEPKKEASVNLDDIQKVVTEAIAPLIEAQNKEPEAPTAPEHAENMTKIIESKLPMKLQVKIAEALDKNPEADVDSLIESMTEVAEAVREEAEASQEEIKEAYLVKHGKSDKATRTIADFKF